MQSAVLRRALQRVAVEEARATFTGRDDMLRCERVQVLHQSRILHLLELEKRPFDFLGLGFLLCDGGQSLAVDQLLADLLEELTNCLHLVGHGGVG